MSSLSAQEGLSTDTIETNTLRIQSRTLPLEEIEDLDGKTFRGRVIGFDAEQGAYILKTDNGELRVPEDRIRTIRQLDDVRLEKEEPIKLPKPPSKALHLLKTDRSRERTRFLKDLLHVRDQLPVPTSKAAEKAYSEGVQRVEDGSFGRAKAQFDKALTLQNDSLSTQLFLGAIYLSEKNTQAAFRQLYRAHKQHPGNVQALDLLTEAARDLGYTHLALELAEESIKLQFHGAERLYRIYLLRREFFPGSEKTALAWRDYIALDKDLTEVESLESRLIQKGRKSLLERKTTEALESFARVIEVNPFLLERVQPFRVQALELRSLEYRDRGEYELFLLDLRALEREVPQRNGELQRRRHEGEAELVRTRLEAATSIEIADRVLKDLKIWIPQVLKDHQSLVFARYDRLARRAIFHNRVEKAVHALKRIQEFDPGGYSSLISYLKKQLSLAHKNQQTELLENWLGQVAELDSELSSGWREEFKSQADKVSSKIQSPVEKATDTKIQPSGKIYTLENSEEKTTSVVNRTEKAHDVTPPVISIPEDSLQEIDPVQPKIDSPVTPQEMIESIKKPSTEDTKTSPINPDGVAQLQRYSPLEVGRRWIYRHNDGTLDYQFLDRIEDHPSFGKVYRFENHFEVGDLKIPYTKSSFWLEGKLHQGAGLDALSSMKALALPLSEKSLWDWKNGEITFERSYESLNETVVVRAGTFKECLKVKAVSRYKSESTRAVVQWFYYAPGVGLVKVESENPTEGYELESYQALSSDSEEGGSSESKAQEEVKATQ